MTPPHSDNGEILGHGDRRLLLALGQNLEQELRAACVELDVAELVEAQQLQSPIAGHDAAQSPLVGSFHELVHELGGGDVADTAALFARRNAGAYQQVRLSRPRVTQHHDGIAPVEEVQLANSDSVSGLIVVAAARSNSERRLVRGKWASAIRRWRRRTSRSSVSAQSTSAR